MTVDLSQLATAKRLLFSIPLQPLQGARFQPTGFPNLGAATYQTKEGQSLLVESAQSMANRLEMTIWDDARHDVKAELQGISHVRVQRQGNFLTDTILESHRLNSPYVLATSDRNFLDQFLEDFRNALGKELIDENKRFVDRTSFSRMLLQYDIGSLLHGCFLSNKVKLYATDKEAPKAMAGGRLRVDRAISCFIEADGVRVAASGGVKNDHVNPSGDSSSGFANVLFARDEFTADHITLYVNLDLGQIRGYGLGAEVERLLILLALYKLRVLLDGDLRLRTACDLMVADESITANHPAGFSLPSQEALLPALQTAIAKCAEKMTVTEVIFNDELKKGKNKENEAEGENADNTEADDASLAGNEVE